MTKGNEFGHVTIIFSVWNRNSTESLIPPKQHCPVTRIQTFMFGFVTIISFGILEFFIFFFEKVNVNSN